MRNSLFTVVFCIASIYIHAADTPATPTDDHPMLFSDLPAKEGWSKSVNGLQVRLQFGRGTVFDGTWIPTVYVEFHNVRNLLTPMEFDFDASKCLQFQFNTADGLPAAKPQFISIDGFASASFHVALPSDGTLRFPVTWHGYGLPRNYRMALDLESAFWAIPKEDTKDYFLSATFSIPKGWGRPHGVWCGSVEIPGTKAQIPK